MIVVTPPTNACDKLSCEPVGPRARGNPSELLLQVNALLQKHRDEINRCFNSWAYSDEEHRTESIPVSEGECSPPLPGVVEICGRAQVLPLSEAPNVQSKPLTYRSETAGSLVRCSSDESRFEESILQDRSRKQTGTSNMLQKVLAQSRVTHDNILQHTLTEATRNQTLLQYVTRSRQYELLSGLLIVVNGIFIGWQTAFMASRALDAAERGLPIDNTDARGVLVMQVLFCFLFTLELGLRWASVGFKAFFENSADFWWNMLDVFVVSLSIIDLLMELIVAVTAHADQEGQAIMGNISVLRVLRVVRIVRIARIIRVMRFFRELRMMVFSILGSMRSLLWVIVVLGLIFYIFGITFTAAVTQNLNTTEAWNREGNADLVSYFGTLFRSMLNLYMSMSGGNDWTVYYEALENLPGHFCLLYLLFITFSIFAAVNIVTGIFVENALQTHRTDKQTVIQDEMDVKRSYLEDMRSVFMEMDTDGTGSLTLEEFEHRLDDERVIAYFQSLKLDVSDARKLFELVDADGSGEVSISEFLDGCWKLQGESRAMDVKTMQCDVRLLKSAVQGISHQMTHITESMHSMGVPVRQTPEVSPGH